MINWNMNCMKERERGLTEHGAEQVDLAGGRDGAGAPEDGAASPEQPLQRRRLRLHPPAPPGPSRRRHRHPPPLHRRRRLHPATPLLLHHAAAIAATSPPRSPPHLHQRSNQEQQQQEARSSKNQESRSNAWRRRGARSSEGGRDILALETGRGETRGSIKSMDSDVNTAAGLGWVGDANPPRRERETGFYLFLLFFFGARERERNVAVVLARPPFVEGGKQNRRLPTQIRYSTEHRFSSLFSVSNLGSISSWLVLLQYSLRPIIQWILGEYISRFIVIKYVISI